MPGITGGQKISETWVYAIRMTLLERRFLEIVDSSSGPKPGVKRGSAFGRSCEESPCSNGEISSPGHVEKSGFLTSTASAV